MSIKDKLPAGTQLGFGTAPLGNMNAKVGS